MYWLATEKFVDIMGIVIAVLISLCRLEDLTLVGTGVSMSSFSHLLHCHGNRYVNLCQHTHFIFYHNYCPYTKWEAKLAITMQ